MKVQETYILSLIFILIVMVFVQMVYVGLKRENFNTVQTIPCNKQISCDEYIRDSNLFKNNIIRNDYLRQLNVNSQSKLAKNYNDIVLLMDANKFRVNNEDECMIDGCILTPEKMMEASFKMGEDCQKYNPAFSSNSDGSCYINMNDDKNSVKNLFDFAEKAYGIKNADYIKQLKDLDRQIKNYTNDIAAQRIEISQKTEALNKVTTEYLKGLSDLNINRPLLAKAIQDFTNNRNILASSIYQNSIAVSNIKTMHSSAPEYRSAKVSGRNGRFLVRRFNGKEYLLAYHTTLGVNDPARLWNTNDSTFAKFANIDLLDGNAIINKQIYRHNDLINNFRNAASADVIVTVYRGSKELCNLRFEVFNKINDTTSWFSATYLTSTGNQVINRSSNSLVFSINSINNARQWTIMDGNNIIMTIPMSVTSGLLSSRERNFFLRPIVAKSNPINVQALDRILVGDIDRDFIGDSLAVFVNFNDFNIVSDPSHDYL